MSVYNVRDFGALGDGEHLDTAGIQSAIEHTAVQGGGTVLFPPGKYLSGTIILRDNIRIYLEPGSEIIGSGNIADYMLDESVPSSRRWYLIEGKNIKNISIEGGGRINGSGHYFHEEYTNGKKVMFSLKPERPRMIYLFNTENIRIRDVTFYDSPCYTIWLLGCENVLIDGVTIRNNRRHGTSDGLDIDCSRNVIISNCNINAGDDCIALKNDSYRLGRHANTENITVSNCVLSSRSVAVRIGFEGDGGLIRDCTFNNLVIYESSRGFAFQGLSLSSFTITRITGTAMENILISNITMRDVAYPLFITANKGQKGYVRHLSINNWRGEVGSGFYIGAYQKGDIEDILIRDINMHVSEKTVIPPIGKIDDARLPHMFKHQQATEKEELELFPEEIEECCVPMPYAMAIHYAENIELQNFKITRSPQLEKWKGFLCWRGIKALSVDGVAVSEENGTLQ